MTSIPSTFDAIFQAVDPVLDAVFAQLFSYRVQGDTHNAIDVSATKQFHEVDLVTDHGLIESWIGYAFELNAADLYLTDAITPTPGDEIAEPMIEGGYQVYRVLPLGDNRCYAPSDTDGAKITVYAKAIRKEPV